VATEVWALAGVIAVLLAFAGVGQPAERIDRHALVTRHNPHLTGMDPWAPLTVGNGGFAMTVDLTGLQTFYEHYQRHGIPLETQARWAWHSNPAPQRYTLADASRPFTSYGRTVLYPTDQESLAGRWLRENPHLMPLPQLRLDLDGATGDLTTERITAVSQVLDLWSGIATSRYKLDGAPVEVSVACHPDRDVVAVRIASPLVAGRRLGVSIRLPRGHDLALKNNPALDWSLPESHTTTVLHENDRSLVLEHRRDESRYVAAVGSGHPFDVVRRGPHAFRIGASEGAVLDLAFEFTAGGRPSGPALHGDAVRALSRSRWPEFWREGAAVDFSGSTDPRAHELERRVVLSQYLTAIQLGGEFPPQEGGLTNSTWYGKHHTEMIWWHGAHFALWGRDRFLERQLDWYRTALPIAREVAAGRGLRGARWPKMIGPDGRESPGGNPLIVWNQPHPIHLAELLHRGTPDARTLARYRELVFETAEGLASMLEWDDERQRFNLGPPLWIAQEIHDPATSTNPTYELSYWVRGLTIAQHWRERLGMSRNPEWDRRIRHIAALPTRDGKYVALESMPDTWHDKASRHDHPSFLMALGQLPGDGVDVATMRRTLDAVLAEWDWDTKIWGWDYPMVAMTAARLGEPRKALDILLFTQGPNNHYTPSGHCPQGADGQLPVYLPANGALLAAVAMMAGGWDDALPGHAPGFPRDGSWVVRSEGFRRLP
jgi:hypothetical protein